MFLDPTQRIQKLREYVHAQPYSVCTERLKIITGAYRKYEAYPNIIKRAMAFRDILAEQTIYLLGGELLAGNHSSRCCAAPIFPEYSVDWILDEMDSAQDRPGDRYLIGEAEKEALRALLPWWRDKAVNERCRAVLPEETRRLDDISVISGTHLYNAGDGHMAGDFRTVIERGFTWHLSQIRAKRAALRLEDREEAKQDIFLRAAEIAVEAAIAFAHRNAAFARQKAAEAADPARRAELLRMAEACERVPEFPARTFYEGVQCCWLVILLQQIESNGHSVSFGRMDQYLYPLYRRDVDSGALTPEEAQEILCSLWIKLYTVKKFRSWRNSRYAAGAPMYQNVTIGGQHFGGEDAANELSFAILHSVAQTKLTQPNLTVRYHRGLSGAFMRDCLKVLRMGFGMPAFNNDEIIIPSLIEKGVEPRDAAEYSAVGCVEVAIPGLSGYLCSGASYLNLPKVLNIALRGGLDDVSGVRLYEGKRLDEMADFDEVYAAWRRAVRFAARQSIIMDTCVDMAKEELTPEAFNSVLVGGCIARGRPIKEGGAKYDIVSGLQVGIANLGNALYAIKKLVFDEKRLTPAALMRALDSDFASVEGERIRLMLRNAAEKFGQDCDAADDMVNRAYREYLDELPKYRNGRYGRGPIGGTYCGGTSTVASNVPMGAAVSATADGRKAFTPLAEGCSPTQGTDDQGSLAVFRSMSKLDTRLITGGVLLNQKMSPGMLSDDESLAKLESMIRGFFDDLKGFHVQYNIVDRDVLIDAQRHPERHRDLIVRVAGYCAFFTVLSPETQNDIISRTEHAL